MLEDRSGPVRVADITEDPEHLVQTPKASYLMSKDHIPDKGHILGLKTNPDEISLTNSQTTFERTEKIPSNLIVCQTKCNSFNERYCKLDFLQCITHNVNVECRIC